VIYSAASIVDGWHGRWPAMTVPESSDSRSEAR
jgi:hypothetical protein